MTPAASGAVAPTGIVQARASFGPAVRNVDQVQRRELGPGKLRQARLPQAKPGQQFGRLLGRQLGQPGLDLRVQEDRLGRSHQRGEPPPQPIVTQLGVVLVEHVQAAGVVDADDLAGLVNRMPVPGAR